MEYIARTKRTGYPAETRLLTSGYMWKAVAMVPSEGYLYEQAANISVACEGEKRGTR
jgi:hypothetical protein